MIGQYVLHVLSSEKMDYYENINKLVNVVQFYPLAGTISGAKIDMIPSYNNSVSTVRLM